MASINTTGPDRLYLISKDSEGVISGKLIYQNDLHFDMQHPIETLPFYETISIKKVYWTDGKNQPRLINIALSDADFDKKSDETSFDFIPPLSLSENITITRNASGGGLFPRGTIQYAISYFDKYNRESNLAYVSPLYYNAFADRAAGPDENVTNTFIINISQPDRSFDYLRIYSIIRTSLDSTPQVKRIVDIPLVSVNGAIHFEDNNQIGEIIDSTKLLYTGGEPISLNSFAQKDNTLFLSYPRLKRKNVGNLAVTGASGDTNIKMAVRAQATISQVDKVISGALSNIDGYYNYKPRFNNHRDITTFQNGETYRLGVQFQHITGRWSEVLWIQDYTINKAPIASENTGIVGTSLNIRFTDYDDSLSDTLWEAGYVMARPVVVYPSVKDRNIVCQGILNPTVYNVKERFNDNSFSSASWYFRPALTTWRAADNNKPLFSDDFGHDGDDPYALDGAFLEYRHNYSIPSSDYRNGEIQSSSLGCKKVYLSTESAGKYVDKNNEEFFIDANILTFNSPDIEYNEELKLLDGAAENFYLDIVGYAECTSVASDISIEATMPRNSNANGFLKTTFMHANSLSNGGRCMCNFPGFQDSEPPYPLCVVPITTTDDQDVTTTTYKWSYGLYDALSEEGETPEDSEAIKNRQSYMDSHKDIFAIYPWHRNGSLCGYEKSDETPGEILHKRMSNMRYCNKTVYNAYNYINKFTRQALSDFKVFNPVNNTLIKVDSHTYCGNVDSVIAPNFDKRINDNGGSGASGGYQIYHINGDNIEAASDTYIQQAISVGGGVRRNENSLFVIQQNAYNERFRPFSYKYSSAVSAYSYTDPSGQTIIETPRVTTVQDVEDRLAQRGYAMGKDPIRIQFNSNTHAVIRLDGNKVLPYYSIASDGGYTFWNENSSISYTTINGQFSTTPSSSSIMLIGNIVRTSDANTKFGGQTDEAIITNNWLPAGPAVDIDDIFDNGLNFLDGDTFIQRYDCLKTYPHSIEDKQTMVEIVSFLCESKINLDGRYDRNRGNLSNLVAMPSNFNLVNNAYSQSDNYFTYHALDYERYSIRAFPNTISWTKSKQVGELIDTWCNLLLVSTLDVDGSFGEIRCLRLFNDTIYGFQDKGIFVVNFNSRVQIPTSDGTPIEITNNYRVDGKKYVSTEIGTTNKWSIRETANGLYFIDSLSKAIYRIGPNGLVNLTDSRGFHSWSINSINGDKDWSPNNYDNFTTQYDKIHDNVYFINADWCLSYSETLDSFTSFFSYNKVPYMLNIWDSFISIDKDKSDNSGYYLWFQNKGDYNYFFNVKSNYYTRFISNGDLQQDKVFNTLEFRADSFDVNSNTKSLNYDLPFNYIRAWNEYQDSNKVQLDYSDIGTSNTKRKFRNYRVSIPRDALNNENSSRVLNPYKLSDSNRIRNNWIYLELGNDIPEDTRETILHDLIVYYTL